MSQTLTKKDLDLAPKSFGESLAIKFKSIDAKFGEVNTKLDFVLETAVSSDELKHLL